MTKIQIYGQEIEQLTLAIIPHLSVAGLQFILRGTDMSDSVRSLLNKAIISRPEVVTILATCFTQNETVVFSVGDIVVGNGDGAIISTESSVVEKESPFLPPIYVYGVRYIIQPTPMSFALNGQVMVTAEEAKTTHLFLISQLKLATGLLG